METNDVLAALGALAQETRLAIFRLLVEQGPAGLAAGAIAERLDLAPATLSFHLKELAQARLVIARPEGRFIHYRANFDAMTGLVSYLTENCCRICTPCDGDGACRPARAGTPSARKRALNARRSS